MKKLPIAILLLSFVLAGPTLAEEAAVKPSETPTSVNPAEMKALQEKVKAESEKVKAGREKIKAEREKLKPSVDKLKADKEKLKAMREKIRTEREARKAATQAKIKEKLEEHKAKSGEKPEIKAPLSAE